MINQFASRNLPFQLILNPIRDWNYLNLSEIRIDGGSN